MDTSELSSDCRGTQPDTWKELLAMVSEIPLGQGYVTDTWADGSNDRTFWTVIMPCGHGVLLYQGLNFIRLVRQTLTGTCLDFTICEAAHG